MISYPVFIVALDPLCNIYVCYDWELATPDWLTGMYKDVDFQHRVYYLSYQLNFEGIVTSD